VESIPLVGDGASLRKAGWSVRLRSGFGCAFAKACGSVEPVHPHEDAHERGNRPDRLIHLQDGIKR
jgi:hypothetical protein